MAPVSFTTERVTDHVTRIKDGTDVCEYLIEGSGSALLVDTGYGLGDLRGLVEGLLGGKPYEVVCTHGHVDHASGAALFDEVCLHPADFGLVRRHCTVENRRSFLVGRLAGAEELSDGDFVPLRTAPFRELDDGHVFDLGDVHVTCVHVPGHTQGMMVLLDEEERIAFFGDACGVFTLLVFPEASTVSAYHESLVRLREFAPSFDRVLRQHGTCESPVSILDGNIELCEEVMAGTDDAQPMEFMGTQGLLAKAADPDTGMRADGGEGNLVYLRSRI